MTMKKPWPKILVVFDCQVRPGVDIRHMTAISRYIAAKRPEVIVCIGDYADMPSDLVRRARVELLEELLDMLLQNGTYTGVGADDLYDLLTEARTK
jgi:hypothetical protein